MKVELNQDWTEFLSVLIAHRVRFVLVGGHAVAGHAEPRFTEDLDVFVEPNLANGKRLRAALIAFGFGAATPAAATFAAVDKVFMLGRKPNRIDILTGIDGVSFDEAWDGRVEADFVTSPLYVIGREQLLANKRAAGRAKDLADIAALEKFSPARPKLTKAASSKPSSRSRTPSPKRPAPARRGAPKKKR